MPVDHVSLPVPPHLFDTEVAFLLEALAPMGVKEMMRPMPGIVGLGKTIPWLWVSQWVDNKEELGKEVSSVHLGVTALSESSATNLRVPFPVNLRHPRVKFQSEFALVLVIASAVRLTCTERADVDAFHAAALKAGGKDKGAPGIRAQYHKDYYAAFVITPAGHNLEAVIHCQDFKEGAEEYT